MATPLGNDAALTDWPNPPGPPRRQYGFVHPTPTHLIGQDQFFGAPGQPPANLDWPVPRGRFNNVNLKFSDTRWRGAQEPPAGATNTGYPPAPLSQPPPSSLAQAASEAWVRRIVDVLNNVLKGKMNVTLDVTLATGADTTTVTDARISASSALLLMPLTANAAAEHAAGTAYVSSQKAGQAVLAHANNAQADRTFRILILA